MEKKYSVLMSVYIKENPEWLKYSIDSMLNQTIKPNEFVLIKDGPLTNELDAVIDNYVKKYKKLFKVIKIKKNIGLGPALNLGITKCKNEYIARMDSDDYSVPYRIERQLEIFNKDSDLGMVGSNVVEFIDNIDNGISEVILPVTNNDIISFSKKRNPFRHPSILFKKSEVIKAGNYRDYYLCEDYDMWIRMINHKTKCYNIQEFLVYMRINDDFYKRRGGHKYFKSIKKFKKEQLNNGIFTRKQYYKTIIPHAIVCYMPNFLREFVYKNLLRRKRKL